MLGKWGTDELAVMWRSAPAHVLHRAEQETIPYTAWGEEPAEVRPEAPPVPPALPPRWSVRGVARTGRLAGGVINGGTDHAGIYDGTPSGSASTDDAADLGPRIRGMAADIAARMCEWLHLIERFDQSSGWSGVGIASCAAWLSWTCSVSPTTAREYVRVARALTVLPLIDEAFATGRLSYSKVRILVKVAADVDEKTLLEQARVQTVSQLERTVRALRRGDGWRQEQERRASWYWDDDGMLCLSARLPADEGALLVTALERVRDELRAGASGAADEGGERAGVGVGAWVFRDPHGDIVPAAPELPGAREASYPVGAASDPAGPAAPGRGSATGDSAMLGRDGAATNGASLLPEWRGEPFHLAEAVGVLARAGLLRST